MIGSIRRKRPNDIDDKGNFGNPLDYNFSDLAEYDQSNSKIKCWSTMQKMNNCCFMFLFLAAVAVSFFLAA